MGGGVATPAPSLYLILEPRWLVRFENFFMGRCPKDELTGKNLVCKKALSISEKNWKSLLGGGGIHSPLPPLAIGGLSNHITFGENFTQHTHSKLLLCYIKKRPNKINMRSFFYLVLLIPS